MLKVSERRLVLQIVVDHPTLSSSDLGAILDIQPDETWDRGDSYKPSSSAEIQKYKFSRWAITETTLSLDELSEVIPVLLARMQGHIDNFLKLPDDSRVALTLFIDESQSVIGTGFDASVVNFLARIRAEIDISLVVHTAT